MRWAAVVPLKAGVERKSRLASLLDADARAVLADRMAAHVLARLAEAGVEAWVLAPVRPAVCVEGRWLRDEAQGINAELERCRAMLDGMGLLVIHPDLPLLAVDDIAALTEAAERCGAAIAPDRHGTGTNAIALADGRPLAFAFGPGSFVNHRAGLPAAAIVNRSGLALDVDTPADLEAAIAAGGLIRPPCSQPA